MDSVNPFFANLLYTLILLIGMLIALEIGRRVALRRMSLDKEGARFGISTVEGAILALLGLMIAFTFSGAAARFDMRRQQIVEEASNISSAYALVDVLPPQAQDPMRSTFRQYVDARLEAYRKMPDIAAVETELERATGLQNEIWNQALQATRDPQYKSEALLVIPAIGRVINIATQRTAAMYTHPPSIVFYMLAGLMLVGALLAGYGMASEKSRNRTHSIAFALTLALTFYVIRDLEYPRLPGLVGMTDFDNALIKVRQSMER